MKTADEIRRLIESARDLHRRRLDDERAAIIKAMDNSPTTAIANYGDTFARIAGEAFAWECAANAIGGFDVELPIDDQLQKFTDEILKRLLRLGDKAAQTVGRHALSGAAELCAMGGEMDGWRDVRDFCFQQLKGN